MAKTSNKTNITVILAALGVVVGSVIITIIAASFFIDTSGLTPEEGYQNVTFTDAVVACESRVKRNYGQRIRSVVTDAHSSRFAEANHLYKIFLNLDLYTKDRTSGVNHYVNCFVRAKNGRITKFEVFEDSEKAAAPTYDDGTNMFGIKKRQ